MAGTSFWGSSSTTTSRGGGSSFWGASPSGGAKPDYGAMLGAIASGAVHPGGSSFIHSAEGLATNFIAGLYETGKSTAQDIQAVEQHKAPTHLLRNVIEPTGIAYKNKYWTSNVLHNIAQDPFGTALDAAALGSLALGGEGLAIRGATLADRLGMADTVAGRALVSAAERARLARLPREVTYAPEAGGAKTFLVPRARTLQGRYIYNPLRETIGRTFPNAPVVGDAARSAKFLQKQMDFNEAAVANRQAIHQFNDAISANLKPSKRLTKAERFAIPLMQEYGPAEARAADLGAVRQQRLDFYQRGLAQTKQRLQSIEGKANRAKLRGTLRSIARTQQRMVSLLGGDSKFARQLDEAIKNPRPHLLDTLAQADELARRQGEMLVANGMDVAKLEERRFLPQYVMHGYVQQPVEEGGHIWVHPDTVIPPEAPVAEPLPVAPGALPEALPHEGPITFRINVPKSFRYQLEQAGSAVGEVTAKRGNRVTLKLTPDELTRLEGLARADNGSSARATLRAIDRQRHIVDEAIGKATQKLEFTRHPDGSYSLPGTDYFISTGQMGRYVAHTSDHIVGEFGDLQGAKRAIEKSVAYERNVAANVEKAATSANDPFLSAIDQGLPVTNAPMPAEPPAMPHPSVKSLEQIRAEHASARYYPHVGPEITPEGARVRPSLNITREPSSAKLNEAVRLSTGTMTMGPEAYARSFVQNLSYEATRTAVDLMRGVMIPVHNNEVLDGYHLVNPNGVSLSRFQREESAMHEHYASLSSRAHEERMRESLDRMFPVKREGEDVSHLMQVPERYVKQIQRDYSRSSLITRKFIDLPLTIWKALVLKYRPAWLVNNILGQHMLLLLHHPLFFNDWVQSLSAKKRAELDRGIHQLSIGGTTELIRHHTAQDLGFEDSLRSRIKNGERGGIVGQGLYRLASYPWKIVKGFGDGMAKANLLVADDMTRFTLARHYLKGYAREQRIAELAAAQRSARSFGDANALLSEYSVKGKSLEQIAQTMPMEAKIELVRKVDSALGDFNTLRSGVGKNIRRFVPFAAWFKVILEISRDLLVEHPEKVWLIYQLEQAAKKDPSVTPNFDVPSWFMGSLIAPFFHAKPGEVPLISTNTANPFATPQQLADQLAVLFKSGQPSGVASPVSSLGPAAESINLLQGFDPFYGGAYTGPGDKSPGAERVALGLLAGLPPVRLANEAGLPFTGKYKRPASYNDRFMNVGGHDIPIDAILRYLGLPIRRANKAKLQEYAQRGL